MGFRRTRQNCGPACLASGFSAFFSLRLNISEVLVSEGALCLLSNFFNLLLLAYPFLVSTLDCIIV